MAGSVVTRFAPSPTGFLHIGGARTAIFNWLYARGRGGKFLLRIEDTDRSRHSDAAVQAILDGLTWLGLDWDGDPVSQHSRQERHAEVCAELIANGAAYKCYLTPAETDAAREDARARKAPFESPWRDRDPSEAPAGVLPSVRFRAPRNGETIVNDCVQGEVRFPNSALDDLIILRSDGAPTYNLAVVVDDHDMGVSHVIRGDDHLNNAARQQQIYEALAWPVPAFAHVPLIHGHDGAKLSKRHGALGVDAYRELGFLADGLFNYLLRLGWSFGDEEIIPRRRALEIFDLGGINKAPARLDMDKLRSVNAHYVASLDDDAFIRMATPFLPDANTIADPVMEQRLRRSAGFLKARVSTLADIAEAVAFIVAARPLSQDAKSEKQLQKPDALTRLADLAAALATCEDWTTASLLEAFLNDYVARNNLTIGAIGPPLRAALTGGRTAPSLGQILFALGRDESIARIGDLGAGAGASPKNPVE